jgi:hypothetical protein
VSAPKIGEASTIDLKGKKFRYLGYAFLLGCRLGIKAFM